jgi:mono/diheme cytochrome c family protein
VLAFKIGGTATLPEKKPFAPPTLDPPALEASADVVMHGQDVYSANCSICHGEGGAVRGALFPDLRYSSALYAQEDFDAIVLDGLRADNGMRPFKGVLSPADTAAVRAYVISIANDAKAQQSKAGKAD